MHVMAWIHVRMYVCMCACNELLHVLLLAVCGCCLRCASVWVLCFDFCRRERRAGNWWSAWEKGNAGGSCDSHVTCSQVTFVWHSIMWHYYNHVAVTLVSHASHCHTRSKYVMIDRIERRMAPNSWLQQTLHSLSFLLLSFPSLPPSYPHFTGWPGL